VLTDGSILSAGAAAPPLLRTLPGGAPLARLLERMPRTVERAYRCVAANRGRLGGLLRERGLARADELIADRELRARGIP
jgi:predicted DCC family thiol-disulfide oxidoreductase YuxK